MTKDQINSTGGIRFLISAAALVIILWGIYQAQTVLSLLLVSGFLAILGIPPYFWLIKKRLPSFVAVLTVIISIVLLFLLVDLMVGLSLKSIINSIPFYQVRLQEQMLSLKLVFEDFGIKIDEQKLLNFINPETISNLGSSLLSFLLSVVSNTVLILLVVSFVLLEATSFPQKLRFTIGDPKAVFPEFTKFLNDVKRYVMIQSAVSFSTGILAGAWLTIMGVDFAILFGLIAFLFNFIPNVGSIIAIVPAVIITFIQYGLYKAIIVFSGYLFITFVIGSIIQPRLMGLKLGLSTLVVFLSLIFWGSLLGIIGMVLCVPLTMALKFVLERSENTRWIAALLGRDIPKEAIPPIRKMHN